MLYVAAVVFAAPAVGTEPDEYVIVHSSHLADPCLNSCCCYIFPAGRGVPALQRSAGPAPLGAAGTAGRQMPTGGEAAQQAHPLGVAGAHHHGVVATGTAAGARCKRTATVRTAAGRGKQGCIVA
jgi:hypothetical protein